MGQKVKGHCCREHNGLRHLKFQEAITNPRGNKNKRPLISYRLYSQPTISPRAISMWKREQQSGHLYL